MDYDMLTVVEGIKNLGESKEISLCLLHLLLPYQMRLEALAQNPNQKDAENLHADLLNMIVELRDGLLGS